MSRYRYTSFPAGEVSDRVIQALSEISRRKFCNLVENNYFTNIVGPPEMLRASLTFHNLMWEHLEDYAAACKKSVQYFLFGDNIPTKTYYSDYDQEVITLINQLPATLLTSLYRTLQFAYSDLPNIDIGDDLTPSERLIQIFLKWDTVPELVPEEELYKYQTAINTELTHLLHFHNRHLFVFHLDYLADMCVYFHVSPHWLFSLSGAYLCNTPEGDRVFDFFCLLPKQYQSEVIATLMTLQPQAICALSSEYMATLHKTIEEGKGVV